MVYIKIYFYRIPIYEKKKHKYLSPEFPGWKGRTAIVYIFS